MSTLVEKIENEATDKEIQNFKTDLNLHIVQ